MVIRLVRKAPTNQIVTPPPPAPAEPLLYRARGRLREEYPRQIHVPGDMPPLDALYQTARAAGVRASVSWYMMAGYAYYILGVSMLTDACFDAMAKDILANWSDLQDHQHLKYLTKDDLEAGTLYRLAWDNYPSMTVAAMIHLLQGRWSATFTR